MMRPNVSGLSVLLLTALLAACAPALRSAIIHPNIPVQSPRQEAPRALPIPVDGVTVARLTDSWGSARYGGRAHKGIDIFAPRNTPVHSTTEGVIVDKALRGLGGRIVSVLGPGGYRHYYAHLEDWGPQAVGDRVERGDVIGYVGNSGNAAVSPTHLHYGIYAPSGEPIDPYPLLREEPFALTAR